MEFIWICNGDSHHPGHGMMNPSTLCRNIEGYWEERLIWDFNVNCDLFVGIWRVPDSIVAIWCGLLLVWFDISCFSQFSLYQKTLFFNANLYLIMAMPFKPRQRHGIQSHSALHLSVKNVSPLHPNRNSIAISHSGPHLYFLEIQSFPCTKWNSRNSADIGSNGVGFSS